MMFTRSLITVCFASWVLAHAAAAVGDENGTVRFEVVDEQGQPLPCRIHVFDAAGKPVRTQDYPYWSDHFVCPGAAELELAAGEYTAEIERGPEYVRYSGGLTVHDGQRRIVTVQLRRIADMAADGWFSGDLHVHRPVEQVPLLMQAEDLHVAPVITWWNSRNLWDNQQPPAETLIRLDGNRYYDVMAGEDEREGGALLYFHLNKPLEIADAGREYPSPMEFVKQARSRSKVWIDIEKPFWWDVPIWLASGQVDSIGLANNHMCRSRMLENEAWGKPRDADRLPAPRGNGFWSQEIYYHLLNSGLRIPPSAGSASGVLPNPVGYNRVYVHVGETMDYDRWWENLRAGRSFVTNGPLLIVRAAGHLPGHVFRGEAGKPLSLELEAALTTLDSVPAFEIVKDGEVVRTVTHNEWAKTGQLGSVEFDQSGWFLVRTIADDLRTFRFASTAPFYVEIGPQTHRVSRRSAEFFLNWVEERAKRVGDKLDDEARLAEVLSYHEFAKDFWQRKIADANAE